MKENNAERLEHAWSLQGLEARSPKWLLLQPVPPEPSTIHVFQGIEGLTLVPNGSRYL